MADDSCFFTDTDEKLFFLRLGCRLPWDSFFTSISPWLRNLLENPLNGSPWPGTSQAVEMLIPKGQEKLDVHSSAIFYL